MDKPRKLWYTNILYRLWCMEGLHLIDCFTLGQLSTNVYLISDPENNAVLIDPAASADFLIQEIKNRDLTLCAILLTHAHFDHMGAMQALRNAFSAPVYVHQADADAVADPKKDGSFTFGLPPMSNSLADKTVRDGDILAFGNLRFTVLHTPGHTPGSVCYRYQEAVPYLFCGDTIFASSCGRTDLPGGSPHQLLQSLGRIAMLPPSCILHPGHGPASDVATERQCNPYLPRKLQF